MLLLLHPAAQCCVMVQNISTARSSSHRSLMVLWCATACALMAAGCPATSGPSGPQQPATGPGGSDYTHASVTVERKGDGADEYWLFTPADPVPAEAPVVVFLHGWSGINPRCYSAWIAHLVRKGHIVIFPRYQLDLLSDVPDMVGHAANAVNSAWQSLLAGTGPQPDTRGIAYAGHSLGGLIALNIPDRLLAVGLPVARVLYVVEPGGERFIKPRAPAAVTPETLALFVVGADDRVVGDTAARQAFTLVSAVLPEGNVELVTVRSDRRAFPPLIANHFAPLAVDLTFPADDFVSDVAGNLGPCAVAVPSNNSSAAPEAREAADGQDFYGYWKLLDGLLDAAFRNGAHRSYALGGTVQQRDMGQLSDGTPVAQLEVEDP
jgi:acetyl esterase/lipase